jgi:hypothetical protein
MYVGDLLVIPWGPGSTRVDGVLSDFELPPELYDVPIRSEFIEIEGSAFFPLKLGVAQPTTPLNGTAFFPRSSGPSVRVPLILPEKCLTAQKLGTFNEVRAYVGGVFRPVGSELQVPKVTVVGYPDCVLKVFRDGDLDDHSKRSDDEGELLTASLPLPRSQTIRTILSRASHFLRRGRG